MNQFPSFTTSETEKSIKSLISLVYSSIFLIKTGKIKD